MLRFWAQEPVLARQFLPKEKAWPAARPMPRDVVPVDLPSLQMADRGGRFTGMTGDHKQLIGKRLGIFFFNIPSSTQRYLVASGKIP